MRSALWILVLVLISSGLSCTEKATTSPAGSDGEIKTPAPAQPPTTEPVDIARGEKPSAGQEQADPVEPHLRGGQSSKFFFWPAKANDPLRLEPAVGHAMFVNTARPQFEVIYQPGDTGDQASARGAVLRARVRGYYRDATLAERASTPLDAAGRAKLTLPPLKNGVYIVEGRLEGAAGADLGLCSYQFAVVSPMPAEPTDPDAEWLGVCTLTTRSKKSPTEVALEYDAYQLVGLRWVRYEHLPTQLSLKPHGIPAKQKMVMDAMDARSIRYFPLSIAGKTQINQAPAFVGRRFAYPPKNYTQLQKTLKNAFAAYDSRVKHYGILNEPWGGFMAFFGLESRYPGSIEEIVLQFARAAQRAKKQAGADIQIVGPGLNSYAWQHAGKLFKIAGGVPFDIINGHYDEPHGELTSGVHQLKRAIDKHSDGNHPIWITEGTPNSGWWGEPIFFNMTQRYIRTWADGLVQRKFYFVGHRHCIKGPFGWSLFTFYDFMPRPGAVAMQAMFHRLRNVQYVGKLEIDQPIEAYLYVRDGVLGMTAKTPPGKEAQPLPKDLITTKTIGYDIYNNPLPLAKYRVTDAPSYVEHLNPDAPAVQRATAQVRPFIFRLDKDQPARLTLVVSNLSAEPRTRRVEIEQSRVKTTPAKVEIDLAPWEVKSIPLTLVNHAEQNTAYDLPAKVDGKARTILRTFLYNPTEIQPFVLRGSEGDLADWSGSPAWENRDDLKTTPTPWQGPFDPDYRLSEDIPMMRTVRYLPDGRPELWIDWSSLPRAPDGPLHYWTNFGPDEPIKLPPGTVTKAIVRIAPTSKTLPNNLRLGLILQDSEGKYLRFISLDRIMPSDKPQEIEVYIDNPLAWIRPRGGVWNGSGQELKGSARLVGLSIFQRNNFKHLPYQGRWRGGFAIESIRFEQLPEVIKRPAVPLVPESTNEEDAPFLLD